MLEVILKKDIYKLGDRGQVVKVANGYARNFLYPQQLAIPATAGSLKQLDEMRVAADRDAIRLRGDAEKQVTALEGIVIRVVARAGQNNQLFGSVTNRHVAAGLTEQGIEIDRHRIDIKVPFRAVGDYEVTVQIYKDVSTTIKVEVRAEGREDQPLPTAEELAAAREGIELVEPGEDHAEAGEDAEGESEAAVEKADEEPETAGIKVVPGISAVEAADAEA
jgi:large subunit ribosomal protein L9